MEIEKFDPMIDGVLRKLRVSPEQRDDMRQECYLEIWEGREKIEASEFPLGYAETACRNRIIDLWRKDGRTVPVDSLDEPRIQVKAARVPTPTAGLTRDMLAEALDQLSEKEHQAVLLVHIEEYTHAEAAEEMGVTVDSFRRTLRTGMSKLRGYFA